MTKKNRRTDVRHLVKQRRIVSLTLIASTLLSLLSLLASLCNGQMTVVTWTHLLFGWVTNVVLFYVLFLFTSMVVKADRLQRELKYILSIIGTLFIICLFLVVVNKLHLGIGDKIIVFNSINLNLMKSVLAGTTVLLIVLSIYQATHRQQMKMENQKLSQEVMRVRYDALLSQLNPHFLFNSLNTLDGLIGEDDAKAHHYVQQLSQCYRYITQPHKLVRVADEVQFTDSYIALLQMRYGDSLRIERNISPEAMNCQVVPISLQLLIENAVKHNVVSDKHPLTITIDTPDDTTLRVSNNIQKLMEEPAGEKVGLSNLIERYRLVCQREVTVQQTLQQFTVTIPLLTEKGNEI